MGPWKAGLESRRSSQLDSMSTLSLSLSISESLFNSLDDRQGLLLFVGFGRYIASVFSMLSSGAGRELEFAV